MKKLLLVLLALGLAIPVQGYITARRLVSGQVVQDRWPTVAGVTMINVSLNPVQGARVTGSRSLESVAEAAFGAWDVSLSSVEFMRAADTAGTVNFGFDGINMVKTNLTTQQYLDSGAGDALAVTYKTTALASGQILDADIIFNPNVDFSLNLTTPATQYDFQSVLTHEIGHLVGLDHSALLNAVMFPSFAVGVSRARVLSNDDLAGLRTIYPTSTMGSISGTVRLTSNATVYGAIVVALTGNGQVVAHGVSDIRGNFIINGLDPGPYRLYAEPMDSPFSFNNQDALEEVNGSSAISTSFTTRYR